VRRCNAYVGSIKEGSSVVPYGAAQEKCVRRAPRVYTGFEGLMSGRSFVFRDVTAFFATANILGDNPGKAMLIRPRRWGKSVLGTAWIEFLRGREDLFKGTWAHDKMRTEKLIGVHLDLSGSGFSEGQCVSRMLESITVGLTLAEQVKGYGEGAKGKRVEIRQVYLKEKVSCWTLPDCTAIVQMLLWQLRDISATAGRRVAIFVDDYDRPCVKALE
jgi:hypothetical protein